LPKGSKKFSAKKGHETQECLSKKIIREDMLALQIKRVGGVDVSYLGNMGVGAVTVLDYDTLELLETQIAKVEVKMPYVPTLLSFREMPPTIAGIRKLRLQPDIFLVDAHGWAHPYRCGFASHLGLLLNKPTVGAAKSRLIGEEVELDGRTVLIDKGEVIGEGVATKQGAKPIYISLGHRISLETAVKIVKHCSKRRIPEPLLRAHQLATEECSKLEGESKVNI
jgi:deoxyribonuclease V